MDPHFITRIVEAALLAASQPLTITQLRGLFTVDEPAPEGSIEQALTDLRATCETRGIELAETASGYRFQVQNDVHAWVARLWTERQIKYTRATLETLAIIAYRQPITRGEIEQVRGVAVSSNIIKALEEREWIRSVGHRDVPGRPELLGTTKTFLDYFGLKSLDQLPPLSELKDFGELDPQLSFADPDAPKRAASVANADNVIVAGIHGGAASNDAEQGGAAQSDDTALSRAGPDDEDEDTDGIDLTSAGSAGLDTAEATADDIDIPPADAEDTSDDRNTSPADDGIAADIAHRHHDEDAGPASENTHIALVEDDDSTGA